MPVPTSECAGAASDRRVPTREACVSSLLLEHWARETPQAVFALLPDGNSWTYGQARAQVRRTAAGLQALGVQQGDTVLAWLPNGADALRVALAINELGAACVPINLAYRGRLLEHVVRDSGARLMVASAPLVERLAVLREAGAGTLGAAALTDVVVLGGRAAAVPELRLHDGACLDAAVAAPTPPSRPIEPWDTHYIIYTSGTTGPSKGVLCSYAKSAASQVAFEFLGAQDRYLVNLPRRNGWFHTGDAFRRDAHGHYFFVDRMKDTIRRRGENISSFEVEAEVGAHPAVMEVAAYAVPSELGEDEVMVAIALQPGAALSPAELITFLAERMAHFMVPRYVRLVAELPKTPTQKVQKHLLRSEGITADAFDRVRAGLALKRERV